MEALASVDWDTARLQLAPSLRSHALTTNAEAIWSALWQQAPPPEAAMLAEAGGLLVWRRQYTSRLRQVDTLSLHAKLRETAAKLLAETLPVLPEGKLKETPQDESKATYFGRRTAADGLLQWNRPAEELFNLVRAVTQPYPGAFCAVGEHKLIVWASEVVAGNEGQARV